MRKFAHRIAAILQRNAIRMRDGKILYMSDATRNETAGIDGRVNKNKKVPRQREPCLHNIWKFRATLPGNHERAARERPVKERRRRGACWEGRSGCTPAKGGQKIRRICGSHGSKAATGESPGFPEPPFTIWRVTVTVTVTVVVVVIFARTFQSACIRSCFLFIHELRDALCRIKGRDALDKIYRHMKFLYPLSWKYIFLHRKIAETDRWTDRFSIAWLACEAERLDRAMKNF